MSDTVTVFGLLRHIRDAASTQKAERAVLNALALRCNPAKKFICWPSFATLAEDTLLDIVTVKRTIKKLVDAKLISRTVRPNRSNIYFLNFPLLVQQVADKQAAAKKELEDSVKSPFGDVETGPTDHDTDVLDDGAEDEGFGGGQ